MPEPQYTVLLNCLCRGPFGWCQRERGPLFPLYNIINHREHIVHIEWLVKGAVSPFLKGLLNQVFIRVATHHDHYRLGSDLPDLSIGLHSVYTGHLDVHEDGVKGILFDLIAGLEPVIGGGYSVALVSQDQ